MSLENRPFLRALMLSVCLSAAGVCGLLAQMPGAPSSFNPALLQLFGGHKSFTAQTEIRMLDPQKRETIRTPMLMSFLNGKVRAEVNVGQITSQSMSVEALAMFKQAGMDQVVSVLRPDLKRSIVSFPSSKVYAEEPMGDAEAAAFSAKFDVKKVEQGKEIIEGRPCTRSQVSITDSQGKILRGTVWASADLNGFPVKIQLPEGDNLMEMVFKEVKLNPPPPGQFEVPGGFRKYESMERLMEDRMRSLVGGGK